jgi:Mg-chelatase subunit ChlD
MFKSSVLVPDALVAMESNLKAILAMFNVRVKSLRCVIDGNSGTASIRHYKQSDGLIAMVYFPALKSTQRLAKQELDRWTGYFIHEICHGIWTDEAQWMIACREGLHALVNGMEDVRIERKMIRSARVDNAKERLVELLDFIANREPPKGAKAYDPNDAQSLPWTLAIIGRVKLNGYSIQAGHDAYAKLSRSMRRLVDGALVKLDKAQSTADVLAIARDIQASLAKGAPQTRQAQPKGEGKGESNSKSQKGEQGEGEGEGEGEGKGQGEPETAAGRKKGSGEGNDASEGEKGAGEALKGEGEGEGASASDDGAGRNDSESAQGEGADAAGAPKPFDARDMKEVDLNPVSEAVAKASKALLKSGEAMGESVMSEILRDAIKQAGEPLPDSEQSHHGRGGYAGLAQEAQTASNLRQQCVRVLKRSDKDSWRRRLSAGRLDRRAYGRLAVGDHSNSFAKHMFSPGWETEITIILDGSESMSRGYKLQRAASLALVVAQAAEQVGVKCEIVRFFRDKVVSIKAPRERLGSPAAQARLGHAAQSTGGSTPLTRSIALCAKRLAIRAPTKRKMIFAVTDGICDCGREAVRKVTEHCDAAGVEIVGLSIDSPVQGAFRFESAIKSDEDVAKAGLGVLVKALEARAGR